MYAWALVGEANRKQKKDSQSADSRRVEGARFNKRVTLWSDGEEKRKKALYLLVRSPLNKIESKPF